MADQFHEYLYGNYFDVFTDDNVLTYALTYTIMKLDATGHWCIANLANYNFMLNYRSGKSSVDADALSRIPWNFKMNPAEIQTIMKAILYGSTAL